MSFLSKEAIGTRLNQCGAFRTSLGFRDGVEQHQRVSEAARVLLEGSHAGDLLEFFFGKVKRG
jgi:hypothetical protein